MLGLFAGLAAVAVGSQLGAPSAWAGPLSAADGSGAGLPPVGQEIRCGSHAAGVVLTTPLGSGTGDFDCTMRLRVEADPTDPNCRRLRSLSHQVTGHTQEFGQVELTEIVDPKALPASTLRLVPGARGHYALDLVFPHWTVRVQRVDTALLEFFGLRVNGPVDLVNTNPMVLANDNLPAPMPAGQKLTLRDPMGLALRTAPGVRIAVIQPFTVIPDHVG